MKLQKQLTAALAGAALFGSVANAEIPLTDELSAYGYIDMALTNADGDNTDADNGQTDTSVAEFELGFAFTPAESAYSAVAELSFDGTDAGFETVTISYQYSDSLSFTFGNILSYQGFETYDATGLYQFSYASSSSLGNGLDTGPAMYSAAYAVGASADYTSGDFDFGVWVGDSDGAEMSYEYLVAYNGVENLTVKAIYADDPSYETVNVWAAYDYGDFTFAVETVSTDNAAGEEVLDLNTFMVYYAMGKAGITVRMTDGDYGTQSFEKFTISPSYAFSDNVFGLIEFSQEDLGIAETFDSAAVELIYSF